MRLCRLDFGTPGAYEKMVKTCIKQDLTWKEPAKKWEALLEELAFGTEESAKKAEVIEPEKLVGNALRRVIFFFTNVFTQPRV